MKHSETASHCLSNELRKVSSKSTSFTGSWKLAIKRNRPCRQSKNKQKPSLMDLGSSGRLILACMSEKSRSGHKPIQRSRGNFKILRRHRSRGYPSRKV